METEKTDDISRCAACGDFPVNHTLMYFSKTIDAWGDDRMQFLEHWPLLDRLSNFVRSNVILFVPYLIRFLHAIYGRKTYTDPTHVDMQRAYVIWEEAARRGIPMEQLTLFGRPIDSYRAYLNDGWIYFESLPIPSRMLARSEPYIDDKFLFKQFLKRNQIPCADFALATNIADAHRSLEQLHMPVVVKPRIGSNSRHTTPFINTRAQFDEAFESAQELCRYVLIEEHLLGHLCRATVVDGKLVGFLESRQPSIVGDGIRSVRQLIEEKNAHKAERVSDVVFSEENEAHIQRQGYVLDSVPENGALIQVARLPGRLMGGETREMPDDIHPKLRAAVERAAQLLRAPLVGFDLIIEDPETDPDTQRWGIIEANTVPFIEIHNDPLYGQPSNVAAAVWDLWKK